MYKKVLFSFSIFLSLIFLSGCATVSSNVYYIENGNNTIIVQETIINLDKADIEKRGYDYDAIASEIYRDNLQPTGILYSVITKIVNEYKNNVISTFGENETLKNQYLSGFVDTIISKTEDGFSVYLSFSDVKYFMFFNKITAGEKLIDVPFGGKITKVEEFFITSYLQSTTTPFNTWWDTEINYKGSDVSFREALIDLFETNASAETDAYTLSDLKLVFNFISPYKRLHSNADLIVKLESKYVHSWDIDAENVDSEIVFWRTSANVGIWYLIALGGGIIFILLGTLVFLSMKIFKKDRKK